MRLIGVFVVAAYFYALTRKDRLANVIIVSFTIGLLFQIGYMVRIGNIEISYPFFCEIVLFLTYLIYIIKVHKMKKHIFYNLLILCVYLIANIVLLNINTYNKAVLAPGTSVDLWVLGKASKSYILFGANNILYAFKLIMACLIVNMSFDLEKDKINNILDKVTFFSKIYLVYGVIEFLIKNILKSSILYDLQNILFGVIGATQVNIRLRGGLVSLQGLTKEPSLYAAQLFIILILLYRNKKEVNKKWIILTIVLMIFSMSFSTIVLLLDAIFLFILFEYKNNKKVKKIFVAIMLLTIIIVVIIVNWERLIQSYYIKRLLGTLEIFTDILNGNTVYSNDISSNSRIKSTLDAWSYIKDRPLFGVGVGTVSSLSSLLEFVAEVGFIGIIIWFKTVAFAPSKINSKYVKCIIIWMFSFFMIATESPFWTLNGIIMILTLQNICFNEN